MRTPVPRGAWAVSERRERVVSTPRWPPPSGTISKKLPEPLVLCVLLGGLSASGMSQGTSPLTSRAPTQRAPGGLLAVVPCPPTPGGLPTPARTQAGSRKPRRAVQTKKLRVRVAAPQTGEHSALAGLAPRGRPPARLSVLQSPWTSHVARWGLQFRWAQRFGLARNSSFIPLQYRLGNCH